MFIVFNKSKINSYIISLGTVIVLFGMAFMLTGQKTIETAASTKELPIYKVQTDEKKIAFTMNCAWEADDVDSILETLEKHKVHITFFVVGDFVDKHQEAVKKISEAGHEIGNHSDTHPHVNNLNLEKNIEQIQKCSEKIEKITGKKTTLYRGPYGEYNDTVIKAARSQGHEAIQWNLDTLDYSGLTGEEMWKRLENKLMSGSIILSHNGTKHTSDSLDMLLTNIEKKGYKIVTVSELIYKENAYIDVNGTQRLKNDV
jgi:polysaccharide deacetylase